jgi:hypothetical protein
MYTRGAQPKLIRIVTSSIAPERPLLHDDCLSRFSTTSRVQDTLAQETPERYYDFGGTLEGIGPDLYKPAFPPETGPPPSVKWHVCIACDASYVDSGGLKKHQDTACERTFDWACPICQYQVFCQLTDLHKHHRSVHADTCPNCRATPKKSPSHQCKTLLSHCSIQAVEKKAWGCPCCPSCFTTLEAWNKHKLGHQVHNQKVVNWSFSIMVHSLLRHPDLRAAYIKYDWSKRSWIHLGKDQCWILRSALERHELPPDLFDFQDVLRHGMLELLVWHTFTCSIVKNSSAAPINTITSHIAMNLEPPHGSGPSGLLPRLQPVILSSQPQAGLDSDTSLEIGEPDLRPSNPLIFDQVLDCDDSMSECDINVQFLSAYGTQKMWPPVSVSRDPVRLRQDPGNSAYATIPQKDSGKARTKKNIHHRIDKRALTDRRLHAKERLPGQHRGITSDSRKTRKLAPPTSVSSVEPSTVNLRTNFMPE